MKTKKDLKAAREKYKYAMTKTEALNALRMLGLKPKERQDAYERKVKRLENKQHKASMMRSAILLPLGMKLSHIAAMRAQEAAPKKRNWEDPKASFSNAHLYETNCLGRYSRKCRYIHYTYTPLMQAYVYVFRSWLLGKIDGKKIKIKAPRGYQFAVDNFGAKIHKKNKFDSDYHFTASDLLCGTRNLTQKLRENEKRRKEIERCRKENEKRKKEKEKVERSFKKWLNKVTDDKIFVIFADSINAGNCRVGTEKFRDEIKLKERYISAAALRRIAESHPEKNRIMNTIRVAARRQFEQYQRPCPFVKKTTN